jgi:uncharacterized membrane protein
VRIFVALAVGIAFYGVLHLPVISTWVTSYSLRVALAWNVVVGVYLLMAVGMMWRHDTARMRARAKRIDISLLEIVAIVALAGLFSLFSVAIVLSEARGFPPLVRNIHIAVGVATVFLSWIAMHVIYAVHYAHVFYEPAEGKSAKGLRSGLEFPNEKEPNYWDFVYFSFVIGMTCQVSDVQVTSREMRHFVTAQGIIAFFYNTVVVALAVNIAASMG